MVETIPKIKIDSLAIGYASQYSHNFCPFGGALDRQKRPICYEVIPLGKLQKKIDDIYIRKMTPYLFKVEESEPNVLLVKCHAFFPRFRTEIPCPYSSECPLAKDGVPVQRRELIKIGKKENYL